MGEPRNLDVLLDGLLGVAKRSTDALMPQWEARRDVTKTLISLASATLVFTITFSASLIKPDTAPFWRYSVILCWLAFMCSLVLSLISLWFSIGLGRLQFLVMSKTGKIGEAVKEIQSKSPVDVEPLHVLMDEALEEVSHDDKLSGHLLRASAACYGVALLIFTVIGVHQLTR